MAALKNFNIPCSVKIKDSTTICHSIAARARTSSLFALSTLFKMLFFFLTFFFSPFSRPELYSIFCRISCFSPICFLLYLKLVLFIFLLNGSLFLDVYSSYAQNVILEFHSIGGGSLPYDTLGWKLRESQERCTREDRTAREKAGAREREKERMKRVKTRSLHESH